MIGLIQIEPIELIDWFPITVEKRRKAPREYILKKFEKFWKINIKFSLIIKLKILNVFKFIWWFFWIGKLYLLINKIHCGWKQLGIGTVSNCSLINANASRFHRICRISTELLFEPPERSEGRSKGLVSIYYFWCLGLIQLKFCHLFLLSGISFCRERYYCIKDILI